MISAVPGAHFRKFRCWFGAVLGATKEESRNTGPGSTQVGPITGWARGRSAQTAKNSPVEEAFSPCLHVPLSELKFNSFSSGFIKSFSGAVFHYFCSRPNSPKLLGAVFVLPNKMFFFVIHTHLKITFLDVRTFGARVVSAL